MKLNVLIVDDHAFFRKGVVMTINRLKYAEVIGEASNGIEMLELAQQHKPDVVVMDIKMPELDGIEASKKLKKLQPNVKIVVLSMFGDEENFRNMLEIGVDSFLLKNAEIKELDTALQSVANNKQYFSVEFMPFLTSRYVGVKKDEDNDRQELTKREVEIVTEVAKGLTNQEIADNLCISLRTVTTHRANINLKIGTKNTAQLIAYAIQNNLLKY